jgi:hypothetical protein
MRHGVRHSLVYNKVDQALESRRRRACKRGPDNSARDRFAVLEVSALREQTPLA